MYVLFNLLLRSRFILIYFLAPDNDLNKSPYETFVQQQANREKKWKAEYCKTKKQDANEDENDPACTLASESHGQIFVNYKEQLELKKVECQHLKEKIKDLEEVSLTWKNITDVRGIMIPGINELLIIVKSTSHRI